jgi:hypothetical protein
LLFTALAKVGSSFGHANILRMSDPLIGLQFRYLFLVGAGMEAVVAWVCLFDKRTWLAAGLVAWLSTIFLTYRIGLVMIGWERPCPCLGNLTDALHISPEIADTWLKVILAYLLIGSCAVLFLLWRHRGKRAVNSA